MAGQLALIERLDNPDWELDEAVKVLQALAPPFVDLSPKEIDLETARALAELRAGQ